MTINTNNYVIRGFCLDDLNDLYTILNDDMVKKYVGALYCSSIDEAEQILNNYIKKVDWKRYFYFAVCKNNKIIAIVDAEEIMKGSLDTSYIVCKQMRNQGVLMEAFPAIVQWLKSNTLIRYMTFYILNDNVISHKLVRKLGGVICAKYDGFFVYRLTVR